MSKVLTIDFDIIMAPSIELYNDLIGDNKTVNEIVKSYPLLEHVMTADLFIYEGLTRMLIQFFKTLPADKVSFIKEHHEIIKEIKDITNVELFNIDHHHDLGYNKTKATDRIIIPDCGNWVKYLKDEGQISSYTWIYDDNSVMPSISFKYYLSNSLNIKNFNLNTILKDVDKLIICNSPQWVSVNLQALFIAWMSIADEMYNKIFSIND